MEKFSRTVVSDIRYVVSGWRTILMHSFCIYTVIYTIGPLCTKIFVFTWQPIEPVL